MPRYDFGCDPCKVKEERYVAVAEIDKQVCLVCGRLMRLVPAYGSISFICYAQDSIHDAKFTGPRQRERYLKDRGLADAGSSLDEAKKHHARLRQEAEDKQDREVKKAVLDALCEEGVDPFTRNPTPLPPAPPVEAGPGTAWTENLPT